MALRGAIIGYGNVAANGHLPGWREHSDFDIVAAADATASRRDAFRADVPDGTAYDDPTDMLASEGLDFVDICTPPASHAPLVEAAFAAGLHVLCEKPTVTALDDLVSLASRARREGRVLHTVHNWLKAPLCLKITDLVESGRIGTVRRVAWETLRTKPSIAVSEDEGANWRLDPAIAGGGILVDHGWHALYCVARWAGAAPTSIRASLETRKFTDWPLDDTARIDLDFGDVSSSIFLTWTADLRENTVTVEGDDGTLTMRHDRLFFEGGSGQESWHYPPALSEGSHHPDRFAGVAEDFLEAIRSDARAGNLDEALFCARAIALAQRSSEAGNAPQPF